MLKPRMQLVPVYIHDDVLLPVLSFKATAVQDSQIEIFDKKTTFTQGWFFKLQLGEPPCSKAKKYCAILLSGFGVK